MRKRILREENGSVYVTKNGYGHLVVMDNRVLQKNNAKNV